MTVALERYAIDMANKSGADYQEAWKKLKWYINNTVTSRLEYEISRIEDPRAFSYLYAVGLSRELQEAATTRWNELRT